VRKKKSRVSRVELAAVRYLTLQQAYRDAVRLIEIGRSAASKEHRDVLNRVLRSSKPLLADLVLVVAVREAWDLLELFKTDPDGYPEGETVEQAWAISLRNVRLRYRGGKCGLCRGPARTCAARHVEGLSCA
jgi:hypothetical protein